MSVPRLTMAYEISTLQKKGIKLNAAMEQLLDNDRQDWRNSQYDLDFLFNDLDCVCLYLCELLQDWIAPSSPRIKYARLILGGKTQGQTLLVRWCSHPILLSNSAIVEVRLRISASESTSEILRIPPVQVHHSFYPVTPQEFDTAAASSPLACPLRALGDIRSGRQLLADAAADASAPLASLGRTAAGAERLDSLAAAFGELCTRLMMAGGTPPVSPAAGGPAARMRGPVRRRPLSPGPLADPRSTSALSAGMHCSWMHCAAIQPVAASPGCPQLPRWLTGSVLADRSANVWLAGKSLGKDSQCVGGAANWDGGGCELGWLLDESRRRPTAPRREGGRTTPPPPSAGLLPVQSPGSMPTGSVDDGGALAEALYLSPPGRCYGGRLERLAFADGARSCLQTASAAHFSLPAAAGWETPAWTAPALREEVLPPASPPAHWRGVSSLLRDSGGVRVSLGLAWPCDCDGPFEAPAGQTGPPCPPLPADGSVPSAAAVWSARRYIEPGGGGGELFAATARCGPSCGGVGCGAWRPPTYSRHSVRSAAAEGGTGSDGGEGVRPLCSRFHDRDRFDNDDEYDDDDDYCIAAACPWPSDLDAGCTPVGEDHAQMRRRSELGRGGLGTGPGRSGSDRVGRRGRSDEQASGSPGHEARTAPIGIAEAGEWLADSPPPGARRPPAAGRCEGIEPGCGTDWPGVGEVGGGWDVRCPGLWPCGASLTGERPPGPAGRTIADDLGAAATEEKRAGGAAAVTEVDGLDLLCDDFGFCSAAPPLAPPAQLGSPGLRGSDFESLP